MTTAVPAPRTSGAVSTEVCRLTIAGPAGRADLAVPVTTRVSTLLPVLMRHIPTDPARPAGTWVLQRLGEAPLGPDATPQSAGLYHGDVLYLRPANDPMPELEFDDVSDGVAHAVGSQLDRWRPELTRRLFLALACFVMGIGFGYVASPGVVAAQSAVSWTHRGVATGATMFGRSVGSAVGVAVFGAVVNSRVSGAIGTSSPNLQRVSASVLEPAVHAVFVLSLVIALTLLVIGACMPTRVVEADAADR